jgi:hypothetical protein
MARLRAAIRGDLAAMMGEESARIGTATLNAVTRATDRFQTRLRGVVAGSMRGGRAANAIRKRIYRNPDRGPAGLVYSKLGRREDGRFIDYLAVQASGATITRGGGGKYLYIPLERGRGGGATRRSRGRRIAVALDEKVRFVKLSGDRFLIVRASRTRSTPIALLVKRVRIRQKFDLDALEREAADALARDLIGELNR